MPYLWSCNAQSGEWTALEVSSPALALDPDTGAVSPLGSPDDSDSRHALIVRREDCTTGERFVLLTSGRVSARLNGGLPLPSGLRQLADRDAIQLGGAPPVFYSAERSPVVEAYPGGEHPCYCARCKNEIAPGSPAVRCSGCGTWHHSSEELPCWSYASQCSCGFATALDAGPRWSPEEL